MISPEDSEARDRAIKKVYGDRRSLIEVLGQEEPEAVIYVGGRPASREGIISMVLSATQYQIVLVDSPECLEELFGILSGTAGAEMIELRKRIKRILIDPNDVIPECPFSYDNMNRLVKTAEASGAGDLLVNLAVDPQRLNIDAGREEGGICMKKGQIIAAIEDYSVDLTGTE